MADHNQWQKDHQQRTALQKQRQYTQSSDRQQRQWGHQRALQSLNPIMQPQICRLGQASAVIGPAILAQCALPALAAAGSPSSPNPSEQPDGAEHQLTCLWGIVSSPGWLLGCGAPRAPASTPLAPRPSSFAPGEAAVAGGRRLSAADPEAASGLSLGPLELLMAACCPSGRLLPAGLLSSTARLCAERWCMRGCRSSAGEPRMLSA